MGDRRKYFEACFTLILLLLSIYIIIHSIQIGIGQLTAPMSGLYPFIAGALIFICSIMFFIKPTYGQPPFKNIGEVRDFILLIISFVFWVCSMPYLGYVFATFVTSFAMFKIFKVQGWFRPLLLTLGISLFIYLLFDYWLYTDLPRGILG